MATTCCRIFVSLSYATTCSSESPCVITGIDVSPSLPLNAYSCHHYFRVPQSFAFRILSAFFYDRLRKPLLQRGNFTPVMDITNLTSPPPILVHEHNANHGRRRSTSRSTGGMNFSRHPPGPMPIPNTRQDPPPPPLPPPRFIGDLTAGSDPGWAWGNDPSGSFGKTGESMAAGSNFPKSWGRKVEEDRGQTERPEYRRRESSNSTVLSPPNTDRRYSSFSRHQDEGYYSLSGPSAMSQQSVYTSSLMVFFILPCPSQLGKASSTPLKGTPWPLLYLSNASVIER